MKRAFLPALTIVASTLVFAPYAHAEAATAPKSTVIKGIGEVQTVHATATIDAIDKKNRIVTLKGENGNMYSVPCGKEVRNFDKLKVGDTVDIDYFEAVAVEAKKAEGVPSVTEVITGDRAEKGAQPGAVVLRKVHIVTEVLGNNPETQTVAVRGPRGNIVQVKIRDPKVFESLKGGGQIDLTYAEGLAVAVKPGKKK